MIPQHIKERIAKDAESQYLPCGGCGATKPADRCVGCFHSFAQLAADGYISGAEAEAERALLLVQAMEKVKRSCLATGPEAELRDVVINDILKQAESALATYNSKKG